MGDVYVPEYYILRIAGSVWHNNDNMQKEMEGKKNTEHTKEHKSRTLPLVGIGLAILLAAAAFFSGIHIGSDARLGTNIDFLFAASRAQETVDLSRFWKVWDLLDQRFVSASSTDPLNEQERVDGAIQGLVGAYGDPYTLYLPPEDAALFEEDIAGNFQGVGMEVGSRDGVLTVIAPLPGTPAEKAGIRSGDKIIRIDGMSTENMSIDAAVKHIRGEKGSEVTFTILRAGDSEVREIKVVRDTINIPTTKTEEKDGVFIIRLYNFSATAEAKFEEALREYVRSGDKKLVIDFRGNPGGYLQSAVNIASYFLPTGKIIVRENFGEGQEERVYRSAGRLLGKYAPSRLAVLIDEGSASASEIVAGALQDQGAATLIGTKSFGKGSVQELIDLDGGASLKVTIARWLTPNGISISHEGLTPDIEVKMTTEQHEKEEDPQLDAAIEYLNR
jgi:carboxyl-terminal processing protease